MEKKTQLFEIPYMSDSENFELETFVNEEGKLCQRIVYRKNKKKPETNTGRYRFKYRH